MNPLVAQITEQVLAALAKAEPPPVDNAPAVRAWANGNTPTRATSGDGGRVLYISNSPQPAPSLAAWNGLQVHLLTGQSSGWTAATATTAGFAEMHLMHDRSQARSLIDQFNIVCLALSRYHELANLANLCDDCWDVRVMLMALEQKRRAVVDLSAVHPLPGVQAKVDEYVGLVRSYGMEIVGYNPLATPKPPSLPSRPSSPHSPAAEHCLLKTTGECGGLGKCTHHLKSNVDIIVKAGADRVSTTLGSGEVGAAMAPFIDHTLLKADATREQVLALCDDARQHTFASVCINPTWVSLAAEKLAGSPVKVCTVIGFPLGATTTVVKAMETRDAIANGAQEIDMVINVGALKAGNFDQVRRDIGAVVEAAQGALVKVILETALLNDAEKVKACQLSQEAGADFVKTSTGFGPGGATDQDVALMRETVGRFMGVKASGGIRDFNTAQKMIQAGATRIGASASVAIVKGQAPSQKSGY